MESLISQFNKAKAFLKSGKLATTKKIIEQFVSKVLVFSEQVEVVFNFHPSLKLPQVYMLRMEKYLTEKGKDSLSQVKSAVRKSRLSTPLEVDSVVKARRIELLSGTIFAKASPGAVNDCSIPLLNAPLTGKTVR